MLVVVVAVVVVVVRTKVVLRLHKTVGATMRALIACSQLAFGQHGGYEYLGIRVAVLLRCDRAGFLLSRFTPRSAL